MLSINPTNYEEKGNYIEIMNAVCKIMTLSKIKAALKQYTALFLCVCEAL